MYVRGNNGDTDDTEHYVNHLMFAVLHHDGCVMMGCDADVSEKL